jgi:RNA polymerase sigma-70 factor, ECF subfamily
VDEVNDEATALTEHADDVLRYLRRRVPDADAADLLAETLTVAWRRIALLPGDPTEVRRWLFGIAHHALANHVRGERRRLRLTARLHDTLGAASSAPADAGVEVRDAIERLPAHLAEIVRLVHWEGFTLAETADIMQLPASTARNHYQRAKQRLRLALGHEVGGATSTR